jgi:hypothetical protein
LGKKIDIFQTNIKEATRRFSKPDEILRATGLINHLGKASFIQGLKTKVSRP